MRELKATLSEQLRAVRAGESITVTDRGEPIARLVPASMPDGLARMIQEGRLSWSGRKPKLPKRLVRLRGPGKTLSEMIIEDRG
ncbi:MAG: type II toxin-antitoxin system prevent-host-death family antitoxin [Chloroflexota bacterium]|nr:type II toxin-antitoxin system prevent-host-death family antitoxin [Chloroflexota bacterium]